jgi:hypothetical protein
LPVIIVDCPLTRSLVGRWTYSHLESSVFDGAERLQVHFSERRSAVFARVYDSGRHGGVCAMPFGAFAAACENESQTGWRHYLAAPLAKAGYTAANTAATLPATDLLDDLDDICGGGDASAPPFASVYHQSTEDELRLIDWAWLREAQACAPDAAPFDVCQLWAGTGCGTTPLHFDALTNVLAQVAGRKRILLYPPSSTFRIYPYPVGHARDNYAMADEAIERDDDHVSAVRFPALAGARCIEATLEAGEALFLPRYYWHRVSQLDEGVENLSINFWGGRKGTGDFLQDLAEASGGRHVGMESPPTPPPAVVRACAAVAAREAARRAAAAAAGAGRFGSVNGAELADDELIGASEELAVRCLLAARHYEGASNALLGEERSSRFLNAIAAGSDACWGSAGFRAVFGRAGSRLARRIRAELISLLGAAHWADDGTRVAAAAASAAVPRPEVRGTGDRTGRAGSAPENERHRLGVLRCCALLRLMTRHGRLYPGLAAGLEGERYISSEKGEITPYEDYEKLLLAPPQATGQTADDRVHGGEGGGGDDDQAVSSASLESCELVIRDVHVELSEEQIVGAGGFVRVVRMQRTKGAKSEPRPLPLVRAVCASAEHAERLLRCGIELGGRRCVAERPQALAGGAAALGKRLISDAAVARLIASDALVGASLQPALEGSAGEAMEKEALPTLGTAIIICRETDAYRRSATSYIRPNDCVLEIGSDLGLCCAVAAPLCDGKLVGVDLSPTSVATSRARFPHIRFEVVDCLQVGAPAALLELSPMRHAAEEGGGEGGYSKVFIDINGNRPLHAVAGVLEMVLTEFRPPPSFVCVKSRALHSAVAASRART